MIEMKNLTKTFDAIPAVENITFTIPGQTIWGLVGTNGAGKTTLLRMLAGILVPDSGSVYIDGKPIYNNEEMKQEIFYLPDQPHFLFNAAPVRMAAFYKNLYPAFDGARYLELHDLLKLPSTKKIRTFSKGMKKQSAIIAALCANTKYILCDEIFDGLDPIVREMLCDLLKAEKAQRPLTILIASHNLNELTEICDRIALLRQGGILLAKGYHPEDFRTVTLQDLFTDKGAAFHDEIQAIITK